MNIGEDINKIHRGAIIGGTPAVRKLLIQFKERVRQDQIKKDAEICDEIQKGCSTVLGLKDVECCKNAILNQTGEDK